jgi:hypothetical protein
MSWGFERRFKQILNENAGRAPAFLFAGRRAACPELKQVHSSSSGGPKGGRYLAQGRKQNGACSTGNRTKN